MGRVKVYDGVMCSSCGERQAQVKGLCERCYARNSARIRKGIPVDAPKYYSVLNAGISHTRSKVVDMFNTHKYTQTEIAKECGVSRQRVSQIISMANKRGEI